MGIRGIQWEWFKSYLTNRKQCVVVNGVYSEVSRVNVGVPQGSILGPLLFLLYINDMSSCCNKLQLVHFADDTTAYLRSKNLSYLYDDVNSELQNLDSWLCSNRLSLNLTKTTYMLISNKSADESLNITIRNIKINKVNKSKFLGVIIDDKLNFSNHISCVIGKIARAFGILNKLSSFFMTMPYEMSI